MRFAEGEPIPAITHTGTAVGSRVITNRDMDTFLNKPPGYADRLMNMSGAGIKTRHWVSEDEAVSDLAVKAIRAAFTGIEAIADSEVQNLALEQIDSLFISTSFGDEQAINLAAFIQDDLGLPTTVMGRVNSDACAGWIFAAHDAIATLYSHLGPTRAAAVVGSDIGSLVLDPKDPRVAILLGDAAGATIFQNVIPDSRELNFIGSNKPLNVIGFSGGLDGKYRKKLGVYGGGSRNPKTKGALPNGLHPLEMDGPVIFDQAILRFPEVVYAALKDVQLPIEEVDWVVMHQANKKIMLQVADMLNISDKCIITIEDMGNTSSASIPTAIDRAVRDGRIRRNQIIVTAAFGAGLSWGALVLPMVGLRKSL